MYRSHVSLRRLALASTQCGALVAELSTTTSQLRPSSAVRSFSRSPTSFSASGKRCALVRPRLKRVTSWPRASAYSTWWGPMKPVPPEDQDLQRVRGLGITGSLPEPGAGPSPSAVQPASATDPSPAASAPPAAAVVFRKSRRLVSIVFPHRDCSKTEHHGTRLSYRSRLRMLTKASPKKSTTYAAAATSGTQRSGSTSGSSPRSARPALSRANSRG